MKRYKMIIKSIFDEIVFLGFGVLVCAVVLAGALGLALVLYAVTTGTWLFDGTNPRFGG